MCDLEDMQGPGLVHNCQDIGTMAGRILPPSEVHLSLGNVSQVLLFSPPLPVSLVMWPTGPSC